MNAQEWIIITADEKTALDEQVSNFVNHYMTEEGYVVISEESHYSSRNLQWECLVTFEEKRRGLV